MGMKMNNRQHDKVAGWVRWVGDMGAVTTFLLAKPWFSPWAVPKTINSILRATGTVAFANNPLTGVLILAAMFIGNPKVGYACLLAGLIGVIFSKILKQPEVLISDGVVVFNGILVGCISVAVFPSITGDPVDGWFWGVLTIFLILNTYIDKGLNALMSPCSIPALSIPFNVTAALMLLSLRGSQGLTGTQMPPVPTTPPNNLSTSPAANGTEGLEEEVNWLKVFEGTVLAAGQIYGVGSIDSSILVYLGFLLYSPLLTVFFYIGSVIGTVAGVYLSTAPYTSVYLGLWGYNALLTAGSTQFFLVPTPSSALAAVVGAVLVAVIQAATQHVFGAMMVPVLSYPFNLATVLLLAISTARPDPPLLWVANKTFPEYHLYAYIRDRRRGSVAAAEQETEQALRDSHI